LKNVVKVLLSCIALLYGPFAGISTVHAGTFIIEPMDARPSTLRPLKAPVTPKKPLVDNGLPTTLKPLTLRTQSMQPAITGASSMGVSVVKAADSTVATSHVQSAQVFYNDQALNVTSLGDDTSGSTPSYSTVSAPKVYTSQVSRTFIVPQYAHRSVAVPAQTVIYVKLLNPVKTGSAQVGDVVKATVQKAVYVGPYMVISPGSTLYGEITAIQEKHQPDGLNPYVLIQFNRASRGDDNTDVPINAELIAYKTGLKKADYLWKLPTQPKRFKQYLGAAAEGALTGLFFNPIVGPPAGAVAWMLAAFAKNKLSERGSITLKTDDVLPIAVQKTFNAIALN
jgi:hypothetical protein